MKSTIIRTGFDTFYFSGAHALLRRFFEGVGAILMLHHVRPPRGGEFRPNQGLEVTPEFLLQTIEWLRSEAIDIVSLDEMHRRLTEGDFGRRFACITFDDGYRDNKVWACRRSPSPGRATTACRGARESWSECRRRTVPGVP
jgi:hypothetical protein